MRLILTLLLALAASTAAAQQPRPATPARRPVAARAPSPVDQRRRLVESSLLPSIRIKGRPLANMTIAARMKTHGVPAVSIAVISGNAIEWAKAYGASVDTTTLFQAGTAAEPVIAAVALVMVQNKKLDLDKDVNKSLKTWRIPKSNLTKGKAVTPGTLLSHLSGLPAVPLEGYTLETVPTLLQLLQPLALDQIPALEYRPQGGDYLVIEQLIADVAKKSFAEIARETILVPLGMTRSIVGSPLPAAFAFQSTPSDLARFVIEIQNAASGRPGRVLKQATAQLMLTPSAYGPEGLGFIPAGRDSTLRFAQRGGTGDYETEMVALVHRGQGAVVMTRRGPGSGRLIPEILNSVAKTYGWPDFVPAEKVVARVDPRVYDRYAGTYASGDEKAVIVKRGTRLFVGADRDARELLPESVSDFFTADGDAMYSFVFDETGKVGTMSVKRRDGDSHWKRF